MGSSGMPGEVRPGESAMSVERVLVNRIPGRVEGWGQSLLAPVSVLKSINTINNTLVSILTFTGAVPHAKRYLPSGAGR